MEFLEQNDAVIDLKEGLLTIDGKNFEILNRNIVMNTNDKLLVDKTKNIFM